MKVKRTVPKGFCGRTSCRLFSIKRIMIERTVPKGFCGWTSCRKEASVKFMWKKQDSNIFTVSYICSKHTRQFRNALNHMGYVVEEEPVFVREKVAFS